MREKFEREQGNKPVDRLQDGALRLSIFRNRGEKGDHYAMVPTRIYTDKETGEVREASSLSGSEPLRMANLLTRGYGRVQQLREQDKEQQKETRPSPRSRDRGQDRER